MMGSISSTTRTSDQTVASWFWAAGSASYDWNTVAMSLVDRGDDDGDHDWDRDGHSRHHSSTLENARLFAQLNLAIADAAIGCWDAKYHFVFWRPVTAIPLADTDGNPATERRSQRGCRCLRRRRIRNIHPAIRASAAPLAPCWRINSENIRTSP